MGDGDGIRIRSCTLSIYETFILVIRNALRDLGNKNTIAAADIDCSWDVITMLFPQCRTNNYYFLY